LNANIDLFLHKSYLLMLMFCVLCPNPRIGELVCPLGTVECIWVLAICLLDLLGYTISESFSDSIISSF